MNQITTSDRKAASKPELKQGGALAAIVPQDVEQTFRMAEMILRAGWAPKGMERPEAITAAIFKGLEVGMKPLQAVQSIAFINGRPTIWGDAAIGLVAGSDLLVGKKEWIEGEGDKMVAKCELRRKGWDDPITGEFSMEDARTAGLLGKQGPWKQYPKRMLQLRARAFALRDGFADVLTGLQVREEVRDYESAAREEANREQQVSKSDILAQAGFETGSDPIDVTDDAPEGPGALELAADMDQRIAAATTDTIETISDEVTAAANRLREEGFGEQANMLEGRYEMRRQALTGEEDDMPVLSL
jgi:hypothetical protein